MVASFLLGTLLLAAQPAPSPSPSPAEIDREARASYEEAKARAGLDPAANVRLALWCESHGLGAERLKHLAQALSSDPANPIARGLLGMVAYRGRWLHPEEVAAGAGSDEALLARLAEYNGRREGMPETADAHWKLGLWCEQQGLAPEAIAHFTAVTRLDPGRADAWSRLGCRKVGGRWLSEAQIAAEQAEAWAQKEADGRWGRRLRQWWKDWLADTGHRPEAEEALAQELEPRAVPTIRTLFDRGTAEQQLVAVRLYDRIDSPEATRELSRFATVDRHPEVRQCAVEALTRRDPKEVIEPLIGLMREQISVQITQGQGPNPVTRLEAEDEQTSLRKYYVVKKERPMAGGRMSFGFLAPVLNPPRTSRRSVEEQVSIDYGALMNRNRYRQEANRSARSILNEITGQDLGPQPGSWRRWLADQKGYAYVSPTPTPRRQITRVGYYSVGYHHNCFAKGTQVRSLLGLRPIESLVVGDQVLSEDPGSGALSYQPIVAVYHNPPSPTLKIRLDAEEIVSTPIHRFWRVGKGWALARDLKPGDRVRVLGGLSTVVSVEADVVQPVFNLELPGVHSFFVGQQGALVHDNSRIESPSTPFDVAPVLTTADRRPIDSIGEDREARR